VAVKLATVAAAGTLTEAGRVKAALLLFSVTAIAAEGAALKVTVQAEELPALTVVGLQATEFNVTVTAAAFTVTEAVLDTVPKVAVTVEVWSVVGLPPTAVKLAELEPTLMVTEPGTVKAALLLPSKTEVAAVAFALKATVQEEEPPAPIEVGLQVTEVSVTATAAAFTVTEAVLDTVPRVAVTVEV
jgi:hypothetical protein